MENKNRTETAEETDKGPSRADKKRHGCLTAWLIFIMAGNSLLSFIYVFGHTFMRGSYSGVPSWVPISLTLSCVINLVCSIALYNWKKWGFWGFAITTVIGLCANIALGMGIIQNILGFSGVCILYGVLQIGKENKGWPQLE